MLILTVSEPAWSWWCRSRAMIREAPLQNDSFLNQLPGTAADSAAGRSCETLSSDSCRIQALLEGFLHNSLPLLPLNPAVCRCSAL